MLRNTPLVNLWQEWSLNWGIPGSCLRVGSLKRLSSFPASSNLKNKGTRWKLWQIQAAAMQSAATNQYLASFHPSVLVCVQWSVILFEAGMLQTLLILALLSVPTLKKTSQPLQALLLSDTPKWAQKTHTNQGQHPGWQVYCTLKTNCLERKQMQKETIIRALLWI